MSLVPHTNANFTLPLSVSAQIATRTTNWRNGLRQRGTRRIDRFGGDVWHGNNGDICTASLLAYLPPFTSPGVSAPVVCAGYGPCIVQLAGRWQGRVTFEASDDGGSWHTVPLVVLASGTTVTEATTCGMWRTPRGFAARFLRIRAHTIAGTLVGVVAAASLPSITHIQLPDAA